MVQQRVDVIVILAKNKCERGTELLLNHLLRFDLIY